MTPAAIYARVSTEDQSCDIQVERLTSWCKATGLGNPLVYRDDGVSGVLDNRPQLDRLRMAIRERTVDTVVVSKMDRLGRSVGMILRFWDEAEATNTRVVVVDQAIDTSTAAGRLQRTMLAALAEFERELILERTRAGIERARALGKRFGAPRTIPEATAAEIMARRASGESLRQISVRMGVKLGTVRSVLDRERSPPPESSDPAQGATHGA